MYSRVILICALGKRKKQKKIACPPASNFIMSTRLWSNQYPKHQTNNIQPDQAIITTNAAHILSVIRIVWDVSVPCVLCSLRSTGRFSSLHRIGYFCYMSHWNVRVFIYVFLLFTFLSLLSNKFKIQMSFQTVTSYLTWKLFKC